MKLDKKVYFILGVVLVIALLSGIFIWKNANKHEVNNPDEITESSEFYVNKATNGFEALNQSIDLGKILEKVKEKNVPQLVSAEDKFEFTFDNLEYAIASSPKGEDEYAEIYLVKLSHKDESEEIIDKLIERAESTPTKAQSNCIIKQESNVAILIISNHASDIEKNNR